MERDATSLNHGRYSYPSSSTTKRRSTKLADLLLYDSGASSDDQELMTSPSSESSTNTSSENSSSPLLDSTTPYDHLKSPWDDIPPTSPYIKSPWTIHAPATPSYQSLVQSSGATLIGSLVREQGHIYSLAAGNGLLYTGSESKNIHVWHRRQELRGFKSASGLVKAIVIINHPTGDGTGSARVFTGHQDGKIRVWRVSMPSSSSSPSAHSPTHVRLGSLPRLWHVLRGSVMPGNYVSTRRNRRALWYRHNDAVSCLSASADGELLYSGSWDRTLKVWRLGDSTCLESVAAHDDAINAIAAAPMGFCGTDGATLVFTGSADGTVKAWRREETRNQNVRVGRGTKHVLSQTLFQQDCAVTSLAVSPGDHTVGLDPILYCGTSDGSVNFWLSMSSSKKDQQQPDIVHGGVLLGHKLAVLCLAAATGVLVLSGSADSTISVWRREAGSVHSCLSVLSGHLGPVKCLAVEMEDDGEERSWVVYSGSLDKSVKVWRVREYDRRWDDDVVG